VETRTLGRTGLQVGVVGLGTWRTFDVPVSDLDSLSVRRAVVDEAMAAGCNLFDSSPMYGTAEEVLARVLGDRRESVLIATKVWSRDKTRGREQIERALSLYSGWVDLYQVHNLVEWQSYLPYLRQLREEGRVRAIGVTHYAHASFHEMMRIMERGQVDAVQIPYNAADRLAAKEVLPLASEAGIGVLVMSPLATGDLVRMQPPPAEMAHLESAGICSWADALLKWVVSDQRVTATIPATSRPERARANAEAGDPPWLSEEMRERVSWLAGRLTR
jgi:aryl-alcohol dehydrogenase-like predicted oxidoreductase